MPISQAMCTSFKVGLLNGEFDFSADTAQTFYIALYTSDAALGADTTAYTAAQEVTGTGYTAGGQELTIATSPTAVGKYASIDFSDVTWSSATITARGALIYLANGSTNPAVAVLDFGQEKSTVAADFIISFPALSTAILRIG